MNTPTVRSLEKWQLKNGDDFLQLVDPSGTIISWIDSDGLPQGNLATGGGGGTPALPLGSVQFNNAGAFGGSDFFVFDPVGGNVTMYDSNELGAFFGISGSFSGPDYGSGNVNCFIAQASVQSGNAVESDASQIFILSPYSAGPTFTNLSGIEIQAQSASFVTGVSTAILIDDQTQSGSFPDAVAINVQGGLSIFGGPMQCTSDFAGQYFSGVPLTQPSTPTVTPTGGSATTWSYVVVARFGNTSTGSDGTNVGTTTAGADTLDGSHYNTITWTAVMGSTGYDVYRTVVGSSPTTFGLIASLTADTFLFVDNGITGPATSSYGAVPIQNSTGGLGLSGLLAGPDFGQLGREAYLQGLGTFIVPFIFNSSGITGYGYAVSITNDPNGNGSASGGGGLQTAVTVELSGDSSFSEFWSWSGVASGGSGDGVTPYDLNQLGSGFTYAEWDGPGTLTNLTGLQIFTNFVSAGTVITNTGIWIGDQSSGADSNYAILIDDQSNGSYAIKTGVGPVEFGGSVQIDGDIGFFGGTPAAKQTVSGAKLPSDTVMASLLSALAAYGIIVDSTT